MDFDQIARNGRYDILSNKAECIATVNIKDGQIVKGFRLIM